MSFSGEVKEELFNCIQNNKHCSVAELSAIVDMCGEIRRDHSGNIFLTIKTENELVARKSFTLLKKAYNIVCDVNIRFHSNKKGRSYTLRCKGDELETIENLMIRTACCRKAYIRGAFLCSGSITDPKKSYHFEVVCPNQILAEKLQDMIRDFHIEAKCIERKSHQVVYIKEGSQIVDVLSAMGAYSSLMQLENVRIEKEIVNSVNRKVNCETANINKVIAASVRQKEDIHLIETTIGIEKIPENLQSIAYLRMKNPEIPLKELGEMLEPPLGKSGVNHRLRKISEIANRIREHKEDSMI